MKKVLLTILKALLITVISIAVIFGIYFIYVLSSYYRLDDNLELGIDNHGTNEEAVEAGRSYSIMTYNIGFGAYTSDYSFFMDGGTSSWAESPERLDQNLHDIASVINSNSSDFLFLQEVDIDGTRTYHVNEYDLLTELIGSGSYVFAQNYDSSFLFYPIYQPHGANRAGIVTRSSVTAESALRRSLPISESLSKLLDLDRCYSITRIPVDNGKQLCLYNLHLSAYGSDASVRAGQLNMLFADLAKDYAAGNYVIAGGDFNHDLRDQRRDNSPEWAQRFPREDLPEGFSFAFDVCEGPCNVSSDSCRDVDTGYIPGTTFTVTVDGLIVSDNVSVLTYENMDLGFAYSDHNPVYMEFELN